jgi:NAD(P)-dependent dehydrogenase (short-subunit alcohol dehydrogenase family)
MLLENKNTVVYGGGGAIGGAVARAFAREGAKVFLAGRTLASLDSVAGEIRAGGGWAETAAVDVLDEQAVEEHADAVVESAGSIDVSFNAISIRGDLQGTPLIDIALSDFALPISIGTTAHFLTARAAGQRMAERGSGVILTLSTPAPALSGRDRRFHKTGGLGPACAAIRELTKQLAGELGPRGVRAVCLMPDAIPEAWMDDIEDAVSRPGEEDSTGVDARSALAYMNNGTLLGRLPTLEEVANAAAFVASDYASAITGTVANLTCGSVVD